MLDLKIIRENPDKIKENCKNRLVDIDIDELLQLDEKRKEMITKIDALRAERNVASKTKPTSEVIERMRAVGEEIKNLETQIEPLETKIREIWMKIPNLTHPEVVVSNNEEDNPILEVVKKPIKFTFEPLDHVQLAEKLDLIDFDRATKVSGSKFYYLKNELAILEFALIQYALETANKHGFTPYRQMYQVFSVSV